MSKTTIAIDAKARGTDLGPDSLSPIRGSWVLSSGSVATTASRMVGARMRAPMRSLLFAIEPAGPSSVAGAKRTANAASQTAGPRAPMLRALTTEAYSVSHACTRTAEKTLDMLVRVLTRDPAHH